MIPFLPSPLKLERVEVAIADLPSSLDGTRIVQLSDFHFDGTRLSPGLLQNAIALTNQLNPDLIVLTGDYVTDNPAWIHKLTPYLADLHSRCGTYAILGNHDLWYPRSRPEITQALEGIGITVLWNQIVYPLGPGLALVGLGDLRSAVINKTPLLDQIPPTQPRLVLAHNPDLAAHLTHWRVDLQLSGHSHGGQMVLPGLGPLPAHLARIYRQYLAPWRKTPLDSLLFPFRAAANTLTHWEWASGLHAIPRALSPETAIAPSQTQTNHRLYSNRLYNNRLYVNRGLGSYFPGRIGCPPEVTCLQLRGIPAGLDGAAA